MAALIPMRPNSGKYNLTLEEMDGLTYHVLSGCPREIAFLKFVRPDFIGTKSSAMVKSVVSQFFASKDAKEYMEAYRKTIEGALAPKKDAPVATGVNVEEKKQLALAKLVEYVLSEAQDIQNAQDPKAILDYANKIGIFDVGDKEEEKPRRYLPVTCGDCEYRKFIEENCERVEDGTSFEEKQ